MEPRRGSWPWFHRLPNTKSVVVYAGMPNYGLEKISNYIELNRHKVKSMPTVVSPGQLIRINPLNDLI